MTRKQARHHRHSTAVVLDFAGNSSAHCSQFATTVRLKALSCTDASLDARCQATVASVSISLHHSESDNWLAGWCHQAAAAGASKRCCLVTALYDNKNICGLDCRHNMRARLRRGLDLNVMTIWLLYHTNVMYCVRRLRFLSRLVSYSIAFARCTISCGHLMTVTLWLPVLGMYTLQPEFTAV